MIWPFEDSNSDSWKKVQCKWRCHSHQLVIQNVDFIETSCLWQVAGQCKVSEPHKHLPIRSSKAIMEFIEGRYSTLNFNIKFVCTIYISSTVSMATLSCMLSNVKQLLLSLTYSSSRCTVLCKTPWQQSANVLYRMVIQHNHHWGKHLYWVMGWLAVLATEEFVIIKLC